MEDRAVVVAGAHGSVAEGLQDFVVGLEEFPSFFARELEDDNHKSPHEVARISLFVLILRTEMEYFVIFIVGVLSLINSRDTYC